MRKYEEVLERCKQILGGSEQKALAVQVFATPVLSFDSELNLHTETTLARLDRKVHAALYKTTRWRSQALTFTLLAKGHLLQPSQVVKYWSIKTVRRILQGREDLRELVVYHIWQKWRKKKTRTKRRGQFQWCWNTWEHFGGPWMSNWSSQGDMARWCTSPKERTCCSTNGSEKTREGWSGQKTEQWRTERTHKAQRESAISTCQPFRWRDPVKQKRRTEKRNRCRARRWMSRAEDKPKTDTSWIPNKEDTWDPSSAERYRQGKDSSKRAWDKQHCVHSAWRVRKRTSSTSGGSSQPQRSAEKRWGKTSHKKNSTAYQKQPSAAESSWTTRNWMSGSRGWQEEDKRTKRSGHRKEKTTVAISPTTAKDFWKLPETEHVLTAKVTWDSEDREQECFMEEEASTTLLIPNEGPAQGAQRGEVRAALRWALWAWSKTVYITDSQQVKGGIEAILQGKKWRQKSHRDLWKRIAAAALKAKGLANHKVEKVQAHQSKQRKEMETVEEARKRRRNEEADKRAVEAAARNSPPSQLAERRNKVVQTGRKIRSHINDICIHYDRSYLHRDEIPRDYIYLDYIMKESKNLNKI